MIDIASDRRVSVGEKCIVAIIKYSDIDVVPG